MIFSVGSLVKTRGREWVVLPESSDDLLMLRPLGGTEDEVTGIFLPLEKVEPAQFGLPDSRLVGDHRSGRLLRDAVKLGFRSGAGPFRSFARISVEPRPYQLVPLLMALNLDPVRLLIADDVGIGKTVEACLIARELIDRGEIERLAVLCPPHLAEQWQAELREKFNIEAELVLPSTVMRLSRNCRIGQSLFELYPFVIVSTDFIKSDRKRDEFLRTCPEFVIVDEAHTCAHSFETRGGRHQRFQLISGLAKDENRHLVLVTATPHSGNENAFRSLLSLLKPDFSNLPENLSGAQNEHYRRQLADHFVQRRRADISSYLDIDTPFPTRADEEDNYKLSDDYKRLFNKVLNYARETVRDAQSGNAHRQRVRWWSALALLRSLASSPAAAAATLRTRAVTSDTETAEEADELGRRSILDLVDEENQESIDVIPGSDFEGEDENETKQNRRRLLEMAREADALMGANDSKLQKLIKIVKEQIKEGYSPIVFCRFIPTAEYVAAALRQAISGASIEAVTGTLPPAEREERVLALGKQNKRVLVATDCLSEGINLQENFNAVIHYDLSWNPTRHEQREGRVDRYGQPNPTIKVVTYYGVDNQIDGIVLDVLIRKHKKIRSSLGISVPVPVDTDQVVQAIFEGLLLRGAETAYTSTSAKQDFLPGLDEFFLPQQHELFSKWDIASEREKRSQTMFAQRTIKVDEVSREFKAVQETIGLNVEVEQFTLEALKAGQVIISKNGSYEINVAEASRALREAIGLTEAERTKPLKVKFELPIKPGQIYLTRTHPIVEGLASFVMETALDANASQVIARRCSVIRTKQVSRRSTALLVRFRYHIVTKRGDKETRLLAEDSQVLAFAGSPQNAEWLDDESAEKLLKAQPDQNIQPEQARDFVQRVINDFSILAPHIDEVAKDRGEALLDAHRRVRTAARMRGITYTIEPQLPPDVLGIHIYLPAI